MSEYTLVKTETLQWLLGEVGEFTCPPEQFFRGRPATYFWRRQLRDAMLPVSTSDAELERLRHIARLIGTIFVYGGFKAETYHERELEKLLREQGTFWDTISAFEATLT